LTTAALAFLGAPALPQAHHTCLLVLSASHI
jgi:hypothetical protein